MAKAKKDSATRFLKSLEYLGNLLPHPVSLFFLMAVGVVLFSGLAEWWGLRVPNPEEPGSDIVAISLLSADGFRRILTGLVRNFVNFAPLGTVLVAMLGVGIAEISGLFSSLIRAIVLLAPRQLMTSALVFAGVISNTASEMGYVVLVPMAGFVFLALGRHPLAGMAAAFAGVSGGYSANLFIGTIDPLLSGITEEAARMLQPEIEVNALANWYFMFASTFLVTGVGTWVTHRFVEPTLGTYNEKFAEKAGVNSQEFLKPLTSREKLGLICACASLVVMIFLLVLTIVPEGGVLRNPETGSRLNSPLLSGVVALIFVFFLIPSTIFGMITGTIKSDRDIIDGMAASMSKLGLYLVLVFFAAQFVSFFAWTNLGQILAVVGADFLIWLRLDNPLVFLPFILICGFVNLMLGSASAQWALTAPIFVPMLMRLNFSPELIQAAYRIGDSCTNIITPMMSYFGLILAFAARFDRRIGIGTIVSMMLPYSVAFLLSWIAFFYLWVFVLNLPVGIGTQTYLQP
ncbi:MAG: AbgT family transporter [Bradymonadales bacterium]|nr:MAG: AbgT family transporter [Bradymonadales bacterium]